MGGIKIENIDALVELDALGWEYEPAGENEIRVKCPAHDDQSPSAMLNTRTNLWNCKTAGCGERGDIIKFLALASKVERYTIIHELSERYDLGDVRTIDTSLIEQYHKDIWDCPLLQKLRDRGVNDEMIRDARLGYFKGRIQIPVFDLQGRVVNVRKYLPGAPGPQKMKNTRGMGEIRLYQVEQIAKYDTIWICGGEIKALVAGWYLNQGKCGAICATAGEGNWDTSFSKMLSDKRVFICFDVDEEGRAASEQVAAMNNPYAKFTGIVALPLNPVKYPNGDINDWIVLKKSVGFKDFERLMRKVKPWEPKILFQEEFDPEEKPRRVELAHVSSSKHVGKKIETSAMISMADDTPYLVPQIIKCHCPKDQPFCAVCPVFPQKPDDKGYVTLTVNEESPTILSFVGSTKKIQSELIREALRMPPCKVVSFHVKGHFNVEDVRLAPQLELDNRSSDDVVVPALVLSHGIQTNAAYCMIGRVHPNPRSQQAVFLVTEIFPAEDSLDTFESTKGDLVSFEIFRPTKWTTAGIEEQLDALYEDLEANVTHIFQRRDLHLAVDLVYHSVLYYEWDGRITKGWTEGLILGDSSQGKTETASSLQQHYGLGEKVSCKNATSAGLVGGLQQTGTRWWISWGKIPKNDRRLVILEELKGASVELLSKMTDMRSSGVAEIPKIKQRKTHARTRLLMLSNARSARPMSAFNFGIEAIRELIGGPEDIRRLDFALTVSSQQVNPGLINQLIESRDHVEHCFTSDLCRRLILFGWTRRAADIKITKPVARLILKEANRLCGIYNDGIVPLIDRGSTRHKIARLATALAVRTASFEEHQVIVRDCHVLYVTSWLDRIYGDSTCGYLDFSLGLDAAKTLRDPPIIMKQLLTLKHPSDLVEQLLYTSDISLNDFCDWCELEQDEAKKVVSLLVRKRALERRRRWYIKTPMFIELLKKMQKNGLPEEVQVDSKEEY